ncbi:MAG: hypothetical protein A4E48_02124 [Methanosaeta sp. PtaU1.Bin060]|jgi:hypothetical protein|nr:MAG: hypothetical protein A4E48_02124 [Methanosaeta sp. PtaU1.Bin060]
MAEMLTLTFTETHKYQIEFAPPGFWTEFAEGYRGLPWTEISEERVAIIAENYSYLLDLLVQARLFRLSRMPDDDRFQ